MIHHKSVKPENITEQKVLTFHTIRDTSEFTCTIRLNESGTIIDCFMQLIAK